jgi:hypothetical protein
MATNTVKVKSVTVTKPGSTTPVPQPASGLAGLGAALGNAIKSNQSVPKPATTPSTSTSNAIPQPTSTVKNAATSPGTAPSTGYGGATYGTDAATNRAIEANQAKIQNDPAFRQSEIERTLKVIAERQAQGLDTSDQYKYLTQNLGYNPGVINQAPQPAIPQPTSVPNPGVFVPPTPTQQIPIPQPTIPVRDLAAIEKYVDEQIAANLARQRSAADQAINAARMTAGQQLQGLQTSYDRTRQNIGENRAVEDVQNARRLSPFSGRSDYALGMIEQERARTDREMQEDLLTRQANVNQALAQLENEINAKYKALQDTVGAERQRLIQEILEDERAYELALRGENREDVLANSQLTNAEFQRALQAYMANRQAFESDRAFDWSQYLDIVDRTGNINPNVLGGVNSNASYTTNPYASLMSTGGSQRTLAGQAFDLQQKQANLDAALRVGEATGRLITPQGDWGGLFRQATNPNTPLNLAGQQFQAGEQQRAFQNDLELQRFRENVRQFGLEYAARQAGLSLEQARLELARDDNARQWAALDWQMRQAELERQNSQYSGASFNQVLDSLRSQYMEPVFRTDALGQQTRVGEQLTQNAAKREELFLRIAQLGLPYEQENQAMLLMGLTPDEIALFDRKYGFNQR